MRCPHCAAPHPPSDVCRTCGTPITQPAVQPRLEALEVTRAAHVEVAAERLTDLLTTHDEFGDVGIPGDEPKAPRPRPTACSHCGAAATGSRLCERCGVALWSPERGERTAAASDKLVCSACAVPNEPQLTRCMACGQKL
jgi:hypothetical protein